MDASLPLPLTASWPLIEAGRRLDLGVIVDPLDPMPAGAWHPDTIDTLAVAAQGIGLWGCDLADNSLNWSAGVYDLFGLPRGAVLDRAETVALYAEASRAQMERMRAYAIRHRRGFTLDVELRPASGGAKWMRLLAAPVIAQGRAVRLHGIKCDVTDCYRPRGTVRRAAAALPL